jgi:hypothetical protein
MFNSFNPLGLLRPTPAASVTANASGAAPYNASSVSVDSPQTQLRLSGPAGVNAPLLRSWGARAYPNDPQAAAQYVANEGRREAIQQQFLDSAPKPNAASSAAVRAMNALSDSMPIPTAHVTPFSFGQRVGGER